MSTVMTEDSCYRAMCSRDARWNAACTSTTCATQRMRRLFDLDADPCAVAERLRTDPALAGFVDAEPGQRATGTCDPHEIAIRAINGQQPVRAAP
ncbi:AlkA N-terminal domain-containing protein [Streptomyces sp. NPDC005969]|uniref:AlkA N-terminal domain-containing protein n=1 Tax=Streptomyces sp. NPDC005969 TaxID=3156722 RepID=UPI0033C4AC37